jgi:hypothetical protein
MHSDEINDAFAEVRYPENGLLGNSFPGEWDYIYAHLQGKDWHHLVAADLNSPGGMIEGIQSLNAGAFVYFLPGLLNLALNDSAARYCIVTGILSRLTGPEGQMTASLLNQEPVISQLSDEQRQCLIDFLAEIKQREPMLCPVIVNSAIQSLQHGKIALYRHDDILQWMKATIRRRHGGVSPL